MRQLIKLNILLLVLLLCLMLCIYDGKATIIIPSLLMAMSGGIMVSKMTLGGLFMMLMAANQQRQGGQSIFRNLGRIPQPSSSNNDDTSGVSVPIQSEIPEGIVEGLQEPVTELIVRRKRYLRQNRDLAAKLNSTTFPENATSLSHAENLKHENWIDDHTQYRIMRQVANSDPFSCLPKALCGISATPPSSQSGFLNDYAYLLKTVFTRDEDIDDLDKEDDVDGLEEFNKLKLKNKKTKPKLNYKNPNKPKSDAEEDSEESSKTSNSKSKKKKKKPNDESEEIPLNEQDLDKAMMKEAYEMEDMAADELLDDDPDYFPYAVRDTVNRMKLGPYAGPPERPEDMTAPYEEPEYLGVAPSELHKMSDAQLDQILHSMGPGGPGGPPPGPFGGPSGRPGGPGGPPPGPFGGPSGRPPPGYGDKDDSSKVSSGSFFSKLIPNFSVGFSPTDNNFKDDTFFQGFKRSFDDANMDVKMSVRPATPEEEKLFKEMIKRRRKRVEFINEKKSELAQIKDPVEKFRIAAEFGERVKSPRQCRILFNNCPFNYTEVLVMMEGLRKVVLGQPLTPPATEKPKDTVVELKTTPAPYIPPPPPPPQPSKSIINLNTGAGSMGGVTTIRHELPTGEQVEINLKMTKSGLMRTNTRRKPAKKPLVGADAVSPLFSMLANANRKKPAKDKEDLFDEDDGDTTKTPSTKSGSLSSLESLKATMLAIGKINNVTVQRTKEGKPVSYSAVLAELNKITTNITTATTTTPTPPVVVAEKVAKPQMIYASPPVPAFPEPDEDLLEKLEILQHQNTKPKSKKKNSNNPAKTASSLLASSLVKLEDDEVEEEFPDLKPVKGTNIRVNSKTKRPEPAPAFPPLNQKVKVSQFNLQLANILSDLKDKQQKLKKKAEDEKAIENLKKKNQYDILDNIDFIDGALEADEENAEDNANDEEEASEDEENQDDQEEHDDQEDSEDENDEEEESEPEEKLSKKPERKPTVSKNNQSPRPKAREGQRKKNRASAEIPPIFQKGIEKKLKRPDDVPVNEREKLKDNFVSSQKFSKRTLSNSNSEEKSSFTLKRKRRKPKKLYPPESLELLPRMIPLWLTPLKVKALGLNFVDY